MKSINQCHHCGATSYKPVIKRNAQGAMTMSGLYRCTGCGLEFKSIDEWRQAGTSQPCCPWHEGISEARPDLNAFTPISAELTSP